MYTIYSKVYVLIIKEISQGSYHEQLPNRSGLHLVEVLQLPSNLYLNLN